ncbi:hypothetical protein SAMD00024442_7_28 [Candidatus Symbiothrix dinenymphae]|nr:hypothetical protein SAMD00024442_7_28 [Candidatus Symbiothrix dinenymphae]
MLWSFSVLLGLAGLLYGALWLPSVQQTIKDFALQTVMATTHNRMSIGKLTFRSFNRLQLEAVYVEDIEQDTLLYASSLSASFDIWEMLNSRLLITSVDLDDFVVNIAQNPRDSTYNFQFLIDAFAPNASDTTAISLRIELRNIALNGGRINYTADSLAVHLTDFQANIDAKSTNLENLDVNLKHLSFAESRGLKLENLQFQANLDARLLTINDFVLELPHSVLQLPVTSYQLPGAGYRVPGATPTVIAGLTRNPLPEYQMSLMGHLDFRDIAMWVPAVRDLTEVLTFSGNFSGTLPEIVFDALQVEYGEQVYLRAGGRIQDFEHLEASPVRLELKELVVNGVEGLFQGVAGQARNDISALPDTISLAGSASGTLSDFAFNVLLQSNIGDFLVDGAGGYDLLTGAALFDAVGGVTRCDVGVLMPDVGFGLADLNLHAKGSYSPKGGFNAEAEVDVQRFDYKGYAYSQIHAEVELKGENRWLYVDSRDPRLPLNLTYQEADSAYKTLDVASPFINATVYGTFTYTGLAEVFKANFPMFFPDAEGQPELQDAFDESIHFNVDVSHLTALADLLDLPQGIPDSILFMGKYSNVGDKMRISASAYTRFAGSDTIQMSLSLTKVGDFPHVIVNIENYAGNYFFDGSLDADIELIIKDGQTIPDMNITLNPTIWVFNDTWFTVNPAKVVVQNGRYTIQDLTVNMTESPSEAVRINGTASTLRDDSLTIDVSQFQLRTLINTAKMGFPLSGLADGRITMRQLLAKPFILSRGFSVKNIVYAGRELGDLRVTSGMSGERNSVFVRAHLGKEGATPSVVSGVLLPEKDSMMVTANIQDIELSWFSEATADMLYALNGKIATKLNFSGTMSKPQVHGMVYFDGAQVGVSMLHTKYTLDDSIQITPEAITLNKVTVRDENRHTLVANGTITHNWFIDLNPQINLTMSDFQVLNNPKQTDSLLYGTLRLNGLMNIKKSKNDWLMTGTVTHGNNSKVTVNIPYSASTAARYNNIIYVDSTGKPLTKTVDSVKVKAPATTTFPLKAQFMFYTDPALTVGVVLNRATGDAVQMSGNGTINVAYDMMAPAALHVTGDYEAENGNISVSVAKMVPKSFAIQSGSKLGFHGDPLATTFDMTAIYKTRADLETLDPSFANLVANPKVAVNCELAVQGNTDKMSMTYDVKLPNESDEVNRKLEGLLYSDNLKVMEMAYLLTFNSFTPVQKTEATSFTDNFTSGQVLSSLASLTTGQLSKALSNALGNNWSIGADLRSKDDFNNVDMDVNVSTQLFDNRLIVNGTVGYSNDPSKQQNFTGDFDIAYKLSRTRSIFLKAYNETNSQYYEQAPTTQGIGLSYKRSASSFRGLFRKGTGKK